MSLFRKKTRKNRRSTKRSLRLESLSARQLMAADIDLTNGVLSVNGSSNDDVIEVSESRGWVYVSVDGAAQAQYAKSAVRSLAIQGRAGNDRLTNRSSLPSIISGGDGRDLIFAGIGRDTIEGGEGNDQIRGDLGDDWLRFDADTDLGVDSIRNDSRTPMMLDFSSTQTGVQVDLSHRKEMQVNQNLRLNLLGPVRWVIGGSGDDVLLGDGADNVFFGGAGHDVLEGRGGTDYLIGQAGNDRYRFDADRNLGTDYVWDSGNRDDINSLDFGRTSQSVTVDLGSSYQTQLVNANLTLYLGSGSDISTLIGGRGDDDLRGNALDNRIIGGMGNDVMEGRAGDDVLNGQTGSDTYIFDADNELGRDTVQAQASWSWNRGQFDRDKLDFARTWESDVTVDLSQNGEQIVNSNLTIELVGLFDDVTGGAGNDVLSGNRWSNEIWGGVGNDTINGGDGNDRLYGQSGDDIIFAGDGNDIVTGDRGNDNLYGEDGDDTLWGGENDDFLTGGDGQDGLHGGRGANTVVTDAAGGDGYTDTVSIEGDDFVVNEDADSIFGTPTGGITYQKISDKLEGDFISFSLAMTASVGVLTGMGVSSGLFFTIENGTLEVYTFSSVVMSVGLQAGMSAGVELGSWTVGVEGFEGVANGVGIGASFFVAAELNAWWNTDGDYLGHTSMVGLGLGAPIPSIVYNSSVTTVFGKV